MPEDYLMANRKLELFPWIDNVPDEHDSLGACDGPQSVLLQEAAFAQTIRLERRRAERSGKRFMLILIGGEDLLNESADMLIHNMVTAISSSTRETDVLGWYEQKVTLGILITEIGQADDAAIDTIIQKVSLVIQRAVSFETYCRLKLVFRVFPQAIEKLANYDRGLFLYPDLSSRYELKRAGRVIKRAVDICGSSFALIGFLPAFAVIAVLVKMTSPGPVLFCQNRVGQYGKEFIFFKFRTMYVDNDQRIHREYVTKLIAGASDPEHANGVYKLTNDPRVTPLGRFLRKMSLDELPQFVNVLRDDMSLVGPRPPLPYEYERYQTWHKRRVLELKPGLTGLWQVEGRSRTTFDEMVRMDLRYANIRSLWLDLKILMRTPAAMLSGRGAC
jgi:lipopolysaccharide/colanic/teichoic acid biosynthesis glycosyltransferase